MIFRTYGIGAERHPISVFRMNNSSNPSPARNLTRTLIHGFLVGLWVIQVAPAEEVSVESQPTGSSAGHAIPAGEAGHRSHIKPFFETYCIQCHGPDKSKGKITLHTLDGNLAAGADGEMERWEKILEVMDFEEMPPEDEKQPTAAEREAVKAWIDQGMRDHVAKAADVKAAPLARRLTNFEYQNTMRDLLGIDLELIKDLPQDPEKPYHFNNSAEFMLLGPEQLDRYLKAARRALASAIVDPGKPKVHRQQWTFGSEGPAFASAKPDELGVYSHGRGSIASGVTVDSWPETGEYRVRIKAAAILPPGFKEVPLRIVMGSHLRGDAGTGDYAPVGMLHLSNTVDDMREFEFRGRIENHPIHVGQVTAKGPLPPKRYIYPQNLFDNGQLNDHRRNHLDTSWQNSVPRAVVRTIEFEAPVIDVWPPSHHTRILPESSLRSADPDEYIRGVLEKFITRAFRRPASQDELARFFKLYKMLEPSFDTLEETMRETLAMVLTTPQFLYHTVAADGLTTPGYELASRLSYFLWGSLPDEELLALAAGKKLDDPTVIEAQARRMLADDRAKDFIRNFTTQWLSIEKTKAININRQLFPRFLFTVPNGERFGQEELFRPTIRDHMIDETVGFIGELIRRNASVLNIVDSDFAWLNEPLAAHYGIKGVQGLEFRAVPLAPDAPLGGLPTQGSVLVGNGTGSAPHPIYRAVWLREAILGDEVAPPPAEVPALSDTAGEEVENATTIKEMLRIHRTVESCNDCHARLDPWGIPFEEYNAIGQYQPKIPKNGTTVRKFSKSMDGDLNGYAEYLKTVNTIPVDSVARVPNGPEVAGMKELKEYLLKDRKDKVAENVIRRLLTYGIGRALTYQDRYTVEELLEQSEKSEHRFQDMILTICRSEIFRTPINTTN
jgi:mono/diheme cytochrome c family protein